MKVYMDTEKSTVPPKKRKVRSDKGKYQLSPRDLYILDWIADQYAVRFDQVRDLLSDHPGGPMRGDLLAVSTTKEKIEKWRKAGWVGYRRWLADGPVWVWLTAAGLAVLGVEGYSGKPPAVTRLAHIYAVNEVKLIVDWKGWRSERLIKASLGPKDDRPIPDAEMTMHDKVDVVALEVEISIKKPDILVAKMSWLLRHYRANYQHVWFYVPNSKVSRAVEAARGKLRPDEQAKVEVFLVELDAMPKGLA